MENSENKNSKGLIILIVVFSLIVLGLGGWMVYDKVIKKDEPNPVESDNINADNVNGEKQEENDNLQINYEKINVNLIPKSISYANYVKEYIEPTKNCEVCDELDIDEITIGLKQKKTYLCLEGCDEDNRDYLGPDSNEFLKYELKIENNVVVLYVTSHDLNYTELIHHNKFIFNTIKNPVAIYAYEGIGGEDSLTVNFWALDADNNMYYVTFGSLCYDECNKEVIKIIK